MKLLVDLLLLSSLYTWMTFFGRVFFLDVGDVLLVGEKGAGRG